MTRLAPKEENPTHILTQMLKSDFQLLHQDGMVEMKNNFLNFRAMPLEGAFELLPGQMKLNHQLVSPIFLISAYPLMLKNLPETTWP
jgi:hypothetical protein